MLLKMRTILGTLLIGLLIPINGQETILNIKSNSSEINGRMSNSFYKQDLSQLKSFISTLNSDVFEYYGIKSKFETDLKRKVYSESEDYKTKYTELERLKSKMISTIYYLDFEPDYYERNNLIKYDKNTKTFFVSNEIYLSLFYNKTGYIQFDQILLKCLADFTVNTRNISHECDDFIEERISFKIDNESLALKIEENRTSLRLLFLFSFTGTSPLQGKIMDLTPTDYYLLTDVRKVVVYNSKTNEIYFTYM
jgi:hypothetical protein